MITSHCNNWFDFNPRSIHINQQKGIPCCGLPELLFLQDKKFYLHAGMSSPNFCTINNNDPISYGLALNEAKSEPEPGSEQPWHQNLHQTKKSW